MNKIYLVTGNPNKLSELQAIFPSTVELGTRAVDLPEIQSTDTQEIVLDKLQRAFAAVQAPVIVEDVSAELNCLNGLPGPFVKYFEQRLGKGALWKLAQHEDDTSATIRCTMGYFDGKQPLIAEGKVNGRMVPPRGNRGFGFDYVFVPEGCDQTYAEMSIDEKNAMSHRSLAVSGLAKQLFGSGY